MRIVVDANVLAAALVRPGAYSALGLARRDVHWFVPNTIQDELEDHAEELAAKARISVEAFKGRVREALDRMSTVGPGEFAPFANHDLALRCERVDRDDAMYMATAAAVDADVVWTRDGDLLEAFPGMAMVMVPFTAAELAWPDSVDRAG